MFNVGSVQGYLKLNTTGWMTSMKAANTSVSTLTRSFAKMGAVAVGSLLLIEREFGRFDKAIRHATSVSETTNKQFRQMSEMALDASVKWNKAATQTAQAFYFLGSAGLTVSEQLMAFNDTIMLSRAMGSELGQTVEGVVDIVRAFGLEFANISEISDQLTKTVISSNQQFRTLSQALSYASSTARLTNNTLAETTAMLGVMANAGIKGCYDDQTEVLTNRGWLPWGEVTMNDAFATTNPHTGFIEYQKPNRLIRYHHTGKMYHVANRGVDLCVTPDHRMWVKKRDHDDYFVMTAEEVIGKNVRYKAGGMHWQGFDPEYIELKGFKQNRGNWNKSVSSIKIDAEVWATFLGWYISEGSCDYRKGNYRIRITQNQGSLRDKMREVLNKLPVTVNEDKNGFIINNEQIWRAVEYLGKAPQKHIPQYALDWSPRLLGILLDSLMEGDGDCNECYYTSSKRLADNVIEIALKLGVSATAVIKSKAGTISNYNKEGREIKAQYDQWKVSIKREQLEPAYYPSEYNGVHGDRLDGTKFPHCSEWIDYDGEVFCAEVPNHLLIVRRNGKPIVSGNSMAGTVLRRAMTNLMAPTGGMAGLVYELGLNIYDTTGKMQPFINIMGQISEKLKGATDEYKNMVFEVLFGRRAIAGQIQLFNFGAVALRKYANEIENAGGTTERVAGKQMKAFTEVLGQLWQEMKRLAITAGSTLAPAIERLGNSIRDRMQSFREYVKLNSEAIAVTLKWTAAIAAALVIGGPLLIVITSLVTNMVALAAVIANPFVVLIASLYALRAVWKQTSDEMKKSIRESTLEKIGPAGIVLGAAAAGAAVGTLAGPVGALALGTAGLVGGVIQAKKALKEQEGAVKKSALSFQDIWAEAFEATKKQMKEDMGSAFDFIDVELGNTDGLIGNLINSFKNYTAGLKDIFKAFMTEPDAGFIKVLDNLDKFDKKLKEQINKLNQMNNAIVVSGKRTGYLAGEWDKALRNVFAPPAGESKTWFGAFTKTLKSIESSWADTFNSITTRTGNFKDFMEEMFMGILNAFNRMIADIAAADLAHAMFGGGIKRTPGIPSLGDLFRKPETTFFGPGLQMRPLGAEGGTGLGMTGKMIPITINVENKGNPVNLRETGRQMVGKRLIINTVMEAINTDPNVAAAIRGT